MNITKFEVTSDPQAAGAEEIARELREGHTLAVSRGEGVFRHLAGAALDWGAIDVLQVDERAAPDGSADRNLTSLHRELSQARIHPMPVNGQLDWGAAAYAATAEELCGSPPVIDVVHLGIGPDGHTASLVPGDPVLRVVDAWVAVTRRYQGYRRMTLTYPVLDRARCVVIVAAGAEKARAVAAARRGEEWAPVARLASADVRIFVDEAAAASEKPG